MQQIRQAPILASHASYSTSPLPDQAGCVGCVNLSRTREVIKVEKEAYYVCRRPPYLGIGKRMESEWMEGEYHSSPVGIENWGRG